MVTKEEIIILPNQRTSMEWTTYLATAYVEGFCEGENATNTERIEAWAVLIKTKLCYSLQGWFGRTATALIESELINDTGLINWDKLNIEE